MFGILVSKWCVVRRPLIMKSSNIDAVIKAAVVLHNFLLRDESQLSSTHRLYCPPGYADFIGSVGNVVTGSWFDALKVCALQPLPATHSDSFTSEAACVRMPLQIISGAVKEKYLGSRH